VLEAASKSSKSSKSSQRNHAVYRFAFDPGVGGKPSATERQR